MKTRSNLYRYTAFIMMVISIIAAKLTAEPQRNGKPSGLEDSQSKARTLPFRGIVGKIDTEKKTFTLKNKSNSEVRLFKTNSETRFEAGKIPAQLRDLHPNMAVRGSCTKTGERQYLAKLVRWEESRSRGKTSATSPK